MVKYSYLDGDTTYENVLKYSYGGGDTAQILKKNTSMMGRVGGGWVTIQIIMPLRGSILQVGTCQILSLAENPRWSRVWQ